MALSDTSSSHVSDIQDSDTGRSSGTLSRDHLARDHWADFDAGHRHHDGDAHRADPDYLAYSDALKIAVDVGGHDAQILTVDALTNFTDPAEIALEREIVGFVGALVDPHRDPDRFAGIDGTDHFTLRVDTATEHVGLRFEPSTAEDFASTPAEDFPVQDLLALLTDGSTDLDYFAFDNAVKIAFDLTGANNSTLKVDAFTNFRSDSDVALEREVVQFIDTLDGDTDLDPDQISQIDGTDHFVLSVDTTTGEVTLTFEDVTRAEFKAIPAEPFPVQDLLALLTGETPDGNDPGDKDCSARQHEANGDGAVPPAMDPDTAVMEAAMADLRADQLA